MTTNKRHKRTHSTQQSIEPYFVFRYLFIFVTTLGKLNVLFIVVYITSDYNELFVNLFDILSSLSDGLSHSQRAGKAKTRTFGGL